MTADAMIHRLDELPVKAWPRDGEQVIVNGDDWRGELVVKLADVLAMVGEFIDAQGGVRLPVLPH